ncbi:alpha/beta hydrolase [candidate division WOR-3 bacterium]|nr:alpha/beta hydrolase [candidate division WOR-3 bacterium]
MFFLVIIIIICIYIGFATILFFTQSKYIYYPNYPSRIIDNTPTVIGLEYEDISFKTVDNIILNGWFIPVKNARGTLLFCHGNAGNISHRLESIQLFYQLKLNTFIFDYRGYGQSEGSPTEKGTYYDVEAAWKYLVQKKEKEPSEIIVFGRSLGGSIAAWLAHKHTPRTLIIESTFTSVPDLAANIYPYFPVRLLSRFKYNTTEYLKQVDCPILIMHSCDDEIVPLSHGRQLYKIAKEPKEFLEIMGTHNRRIIESKRRYENCLDSFISRYLEN